MRRKRETYEKSFFSIINLRDFGIFNYSIWKKHKSITDK